MKAYEICSPDGIDALRLTDRPDPAPGPGQVLVRMRASSLNYRDLATVLDPVPRGIPFPRIPNSDGAGEIVAVGSGVTRFRPGDRVASCFFQDWEDGGITPEAMQSALGGPLDGVLTELAVLRERGVAPIPGHLSFEEAATLPCAALTAWNALFGAGQLKPGETVLLLGTGGVSVFALQFAVMAGARVIITSSSDDKLAKARAMGAAETVNYRKTPDWEKAVLALTQGRGVDIVVEVGGPGTLPRSVEAVRVGGCIGLIGVLTAGQINPTAIMRKSVRLQGIYVGSRALFGAMNRAITKAALRPVIDKVFAFDKARDAYRHLQAAGHFGKIVVKI